MIYIFMKCGERRWHRKNNIGPRWAKGPCTYSQTPPRWAKGGLGRACAMAPQRRSAETGD